MISYRLEERTSARTESCEAVASMRRARTRIVIVDASGEIVAADPAARGLLAGIEACGARQLPRVIADVLREWRASAGERTDRISTALPGLLLRSMHLDGPQGWTALLLEPVATREHLEAASRHFRLSPREIDVLRLLLAGESASEIAQRLAIGECTVGDYIKRLFAKTRVRNRSEMIAKILGWRVS